MKPLILRAPLLLVLFALLLIQGCKDKEDEVIQPEIKTEEIIANSPSSALLQGNIINKGKYPILDYGFVINSTSDVSLTSGYKLSMGRDAAVGKYSKEALGLQSFVTNKSNAMLYAKAYIANEKGTVFGQLVSVKLPSTTTQGISPNAGKAGEIITITGSFYTSNPNDVQVTFGNRTAKQIEVSPNKIVVEVPSAIDLGYYYATRQVPVVLRLKDETFNVSSTFKVLPTITDFSPKSGHAGTIVLISGDNFIYNSYYGTARVFFGQKEVSTITNGSYELRVTVPTGLTTEKVPISVLIDGVTTVLPEEFTLLPHSITSVSPAAGLQGSSFTIYGSGFPLTYPYSSSVSVTVGDVPATISYVSFNQINATVPPGAYIGNNDVAVTVGTHTVKAQQQYDVIAPAVTSFSPASAGLSKEITIYGTFQPGNTYPVYFGTVAANSHVATATYIKVMVPLNAPVGPTQLAVQFGNQRVYTSEDFTVLEPKITSFTPGIGPAGTTVTLNVANFTPYYYTAARFGSAAAQVVSYSGSTMVVKVPSGIVGTVKISVLHSGRTITSTEDFVVTE
ncbi:IPT/TIG domain-containing protein [Pontibacter cellulosilyticus]|uniref:IPT/TIG domain-containing protein n=1 Tax=Pontibacter cellulosilyticus TaxID=1720253 RepID=A0A923SJK3_9BACT|nr:IPT/TIG domain-containing protein [Pontibacter cellulosilyticus]MBC5992831.1 IPT/TIG domain-containing protein [Pontibacter cellulosilyticus]